MYYLQSLLLFQVNSGFQQEACDGFQDLMQKAMSFNYVAIISDKKNDYRIPLWFMSKIEAI